MIVAVVPEMPVCRQLMARKKVMKKMTLCVCNLGCFGQGEP